MNILIKRERRAGDLELLYTDTSYFVNPVSVKVKVFPNNRKELIIYTCFDNYTFKYSEIVDLEVRIDKSNYLDLQMSKEIMDAWGGKN